MKLWLGDTKERAHLLLLTQRYRLTLWIREGLFIITRFAFEIMRCKITHSHLRSADGRHDSLCMCCWWHQTLWFLRPAKSTDVTSTQNLRISSSGYSTSKACALKIPEDKTRHGAAVSADHPWSRSEWPHAWKPARHGHGHIQSRFSHWPFGNACIPTLSLRS